MTPIVFPHTFITDTRKEKFLKVFGSLAMLSPVAGDSGSDPRVVSVVPGTCDDPRFESAVRAYRQFAADSMDGAGSYLKGQAKIPLFDTDGSAAIRSEVWKSTSGAPVDSSSESPRDRLLRARVVLAIARDYDQRKHEIETELETLARRERLLMEQLQGEAMFEDSFQASPPDTGHEDHMNLRISAWAEVFLALCSEKEGISGFYFLATSLEAVELLKEKVPELVSVCGLDSRSVSSEKIPSLVRDLSMRDVSEINLKNSALDRDKEGSDLVFLVAPGIPPELFFLRMTDATVLEEGKNETVRNTVICFFHEQMV